MPQVSLVHWNQVSSLWVAACMSWSRALALEVFACMGPRVIMLLGTSTHSVSRCCQSTRGCRGIQMLSSARVQDEENGGGYGGPHCMVPAGYGAITDALAAQLDVRLNCPVASVTDGMDGVLVVTQTGT